MRRSALVSILVGWERLWCFSTCVCVPCENKHWVTGWEHVHAETRFNLRTRTGLDWVRLCVCVRVLYTSAFSESIRPFAPSANIWECDNCRECENIYFLPDGWDLKGETLSDVLQMHDLFVTMKSEGMGKGKDSWRVFLKNTWTSECGWRLHSSNWNGTSRKDDRPRQNCAFICILHSQSVTLQFTWLLCSELFWCYKR